MKITSIMVVAAEGQDSLDKDGPVVDCGCDTIAEAKRRAKYYLTEEYMLTSESTVRLNYSQVLVNGKCQYDYFNTEVR